MNTLFLAVILGGGLAGLAQAMTCVFNTRCDEHAPCTDARYSLAVNDRNNADQTNIALPEGTAAATMARAGNHGETGFFYIAPLRGAARLLSIVPSGAARLSVHHVDLGVVTYRGQCEVSG